VAASPNRRAIRWLHAELPALVSSGVISAENARAIERHYETSATPSRNVGFVLLATVGSALVAAGIVLLIAHNWDEFSRPVRSVFAFIPLIASQLLAAFVLLRRDASRPWRESAAIFNVAGIGTAISLVSQTFQIHGSLANFMLVWLLLSLPLIYLLRTTLGAIAYLLGTVIWLFVREKSRGFDPMLFWLLLALVVPYFVRAYRHARTAGETSGLAIVLASVAGIGLGFTADFTGSNLGVLAFAGFFAVIYICGIEFFPSPSANRLHLLALFGGIAIGVMTIVLTFEDVWRRRSAPVWPTHASQLLGVAIELSLPISAIALAVWSFLRGRVRFSVLAAAFPLVAVIGWVIAGLCEYPYGSGTSTRCDVAAAILFNLYALTLGIELIARGLAAKSTARANFGLLIIAGLAVARFFDSDLSFVIRAISFIVIGLGFLFTNFLLFKRRSAA
jgi:uncharacterized membrane protein